jgi:pSer/pThr/pTyr-binding forkhead associated (FHA) protein
LSTPLFFRVYKNEKIFVVKQFVNEDRIIIGNGAGAQIDLQSSDVSSIHCLIEKRDDGFYICDLGSEQGTYINGKQVLDQLINSGESFQVGPFKISFMMGNQKNIEFEQRDREQLQENKKNSEEVAQAQAERVAIKTALATEPTKGNYQAPVQKAVPQQPMQKDARVQKPLSSKAKSLKELIKPGGGSRVEVIVSWQERIINTYHFSTSGERSLGVKGDILVPDGTAPAAWKILKYSGTYLEISLAPDMIAEVLREGECHIVQEIRFTLKENEVCFVQLLNGMQLAIRFAPKTAVMLFDSPFVLGISEFIGVLASLILAVVTSLIVSVNKPQPEPAEEITERMAKVVFTRPTIPNSPEEEVLAVIEKNPEAKPEPPKPDPKIEKVSLAEKKQESQIQGQSNIAENRKEQQSESGRAAEVKPKDQANKAKMFTSTKQGGAIKTGATNGANAKSKEPDLKNTGLLAAFGSGGSRNKLDKAYSGSGELLGAGEKATGASGFNSNRSGDDLGSKAKDTGAGGAGTATQGIAGVGTLGRGTGMAGLGAGTGFGDKGKVQIAAGGGEEEFTGSIDKEAVRRVVKSALAQFKACYEREYRMNSKLEGKVVIQWEIHEQGVAKNAKVVRSKSTINNSAVEGCVKNRMMALKFPEPPPGTAAEVTYPFIFQGQKL